MDLITEEPEVDEPVVVEPIENLSLAFVTDEESYNTNIWKSYTDEYPWSDGYTAFPWLVVKFDDNTEVSYTVKFVDAEGAIVPIADAVAAELNTKYSETRGEASVSEGVLTLDAGYCSEVEGMLFNTIDVPGAANVKDVVITVGDKTYNTVTE